MCIKFTHLKMSLKKDLIVEKENSNFPFNARSNAPGVKED